MRKIISLIFLLGYSICGLQAQHESQEVVVSINAISGMQFDKVRFHVKPGVKVRINFSNTDDMSHNFLLTKPGARLEVVNEALKLEERGPELSYIPKSSNVLWAIPVISPDQTATLNFISPSQAGAYPYVCTYPGHGFIMYGVMYVSNEGVMPDMLLDPNIPPARKEKDISHSIAQGISHSQEVKASHAEHPYENVPPFLYRIFMDDSGPASIAVNLPRDISYCWDAGLCRLRYAWSGGFLDNTVVWKGHKDANAKILGSVFYRENSAYPIIIGNDDKVPLVKFKGYRLVNKYPEFHYQLNDIDIYELIQPKGDGAGLIRIYRIPNAGNIVWFNSGSYNGTVTYASSAGEWIDGRLKLSPEQARQFSVTMTNYSLVFNTRKKK